MKYRLIEDGNGWYIIQFYFGEDGKWEELNNYYYWLEGAETEVFQLKARKKKEELAKIVKRVIEEF